MILGTDPATARLRFQQQPYIVFAILLIGFIVISFLITQFTPLFGLGFISLLTVEAALIGVACVVYMSLSSSPIWIMCPHCNKPIATNTPWVCACNHSNFNIDEFPFSNRCEKCSDHPKAYKCHHKGCGQLIFLSKDMAETNVARAVNAPVSEAEEAPAEKTNPREEKEKKLHEIEMAELEVRLNEAKQRKDGPKIKTKAEKLKESLNDFYTGSFGAREEAGKLKAKIAEEYKDQPAEIEWRHKVIDEWLRDNI